MSDIGITVLSLQVDEALLFVRILVASLLGLAIGLERQFSTSYAQARVYVIFAAGTCLFTLISSDAVAHAAVGSTGDVTRISGQIVSGIGFICAAFIIKENLAVRGLTSAVTLWTTAAIGMACGYGMYLIAVLSSSLILVILLITRRRSNESDGPNS